jgi:hypothetical protein
VSRGRVPFTQAEVTRAVRGAIKGGLVGSEVRLDPEGNITILSRGKGERPSDQYDDPADFMDRLGEARGWDRAPPLAARPRVRLRKEPKA